MVADNVCAILLEFTHSQCLRNILLVLAELKHCNQVFLWSDRLRCSRCWCFWDRCSCGTDEMQGHNQRTL